MLDVVWSIYKITNLLNDKVYIGQSKDPKTRWSRHKSNVRLNKQINHHLYAAMRKYGMENFVFEIIFQTKIMEEIDNFEIYFIKQYCSTNRDIGYNNSPGGQANKLVSSETRAKYSKIHKGNKYRLGQKVSEETKKLISQANKGKKNRLGVKVSDETKKLLSQINTGKKYSQEVKDKKSKSMIGKNAGEKNGMFGVSSEKASCAKLTFGKAKEIRFEYSSGNISMLKLAKKYNVSKRTIFNIIHNKIYTK